MKKLLMLLSALMMLAVGSVCLAADGGILNKEQAVAEKLTAELSAEAPAYANVAAGFDASLKEKLTEQNFPELLKQVKEKLGRYQEMKFYNFRRYDEADELVYSAKFSKEKEVAASFVFNKSGKLLNFMLTPIHPKDKQEQAAAQQEAGK